MLAPPPAIAPAVVRALERFQCSLEQTFGRRLRELVLFGSQARGNAHEDSDVDVLVVVDELTEKERRIAIDLAYDANAAERDAWVGISPMVYSAAQTSELRQRERLIMSDIARDGHWLMGPKPPADQRERAR